MAVEEGGLSRRQAAAHFGVSYSSAILWVKRYRETGSLKPRRIGSYRPKKIVGAYRDWLLSRCLEENFTLNGLVAELAERGLEVDYRTVWNFVHAEDLSFKKNRARQRTGPSRRGVATSTVAEVFKTGLTPPVWSSSTRPGPKPTWRRSGLGRRAARGSGPRRPTAAGRP